MSDPNVFAILIAHDSKNRARDAFRLPQNVHGYCKAVGDIVHGIAEEPTIDSREPTPAPGPFVDYFKYGSADRILLRLDRPPKDQSRGWQFGTDPRVCDYLLGHRGTTGISSRQFHIAINHRLRVELHDTSRYGTCIGHDGQAKDIVVKSDKRLLSFGPGERKPWAEIIVYAPDEEGLAFKVEFPNHHMQSGEYWKSLKEFVDNSARDLPTVTALGLESIPPTAPASHQPRTPCKQPVFLGHQEIGHGEFGTVYTVVDAREGHVYASKKFKAPPSTQGNGKKRKLNQRKMEWMKGIRNEYNIMKKNPHPNIVQVVYFQERPEPELVMEYCSLGNLEDLQGVKGPQYISASRQMLNGLRHLHENRVVHRDLKPANLLVANLFPFIIKISDFGLSKVVTGDVFLKTICGTPIYVAPDVCAPRETGYGPEVDMWSAGVIMLKFIFGLPSYDDIKELHEWPDLLVETIDDLDENSDQVVDIIKHMVTKTPEDRFTAEQCLLKGCENGLFRRSSDGQIIDAAVDDPTKVATQAKSEVAPQAAVSSNDEIATPTQSLRGTKNGIPNITSSLLAGELWGNDEIAKLQSTQLTPTPNSNSGPPQRRLKVSPMSSWSFTIGLGHSDSEGGFEMEGGGNDCDEGPVTGIYIRKDCFTDSLQDHSVIENEAHNVRQETSASPKSDQKSGNYQTSLTNSFAAYILELENLT